MDSLSYRLLDRSYVFYTWPNQSTPFCKPNGTMGIFVGIQLTFNLLLPKNTPYIFHSNHHRTGGIKRIACKVIYCSVKSFFS